MIFIDRHNQHGKAFTVRREIIRTESNSSRWYLNGKASSFKAVRFEFCSFCSLEVSVFIRGSLKYARKTHGYWLIIRIATRLQPNTGNTLQPVFMMFTRSCVTLP